MGKPWTLGDIARHEGVPIGVVRALFIRGKVKDRGRVGPYRIVYEEDIPAIHDLLIAAGYPRASEPAVA